MYRIILLFLISFLLFMPLDAQKDMNSILSEKYASLTAEHLPGFYLGIIKYGNPIYSKAFGMANLEHFVPFSGRTVSDLGSVGKQLTVMGILQLKEEGKLNLDDEIHLHLSKLPALNEKVTIKHLIHHTSGIPDVYALHSLKGFRYGDHISQSDAYRFLEARPVVDFTPGSRYRYSNTGFMLLAEIIKEVSGRSFEAYLKEMVFSPLDMNQTFIMDVPGEIFTYMADSYVASSQGNYTKRYDNSTLQGGGGIYASGYDVLKWIDNFRTKKVGNEDSFQFMLTNAKLSTGETIDYAGGINVDQYRGIERYHHNGSSAGARTRLVFYPKHQLGFIVKSNTPSVGYSQFTEIENLIIDQYLNDFASKQKSNDNPEERLINNSVTPSADVYTGKYYNEAIDLTIHANIENGELQLSNFYYPLSSLQYQGDDKFSDNRNSAIFFKGKDDEIKGMIIETPRASGIEFLKRNE
ncbi:MAG: beta-lactamase family protein [Saprospiraceae bacterium]|nr:beta-lactamase family protein [Saprospiraceae bacterium]